MDVQRLIDIIGADFFTGVPDSRLRPLLDCLMDKYGINKEHHIIAANEGNSVALAAGYHLASGKVPVVYMQNSGEGNIINPLASLMNDKVYGIPCVFIIGWRGEPGLHDEPQHIFQGMVTLKLLSDMDVSYFVISKDTEEEEVMASMKEFRALLDKGKCAAFVIKKGGLTYSNKVEYKNSNSMKREEVIEHIIKYSKNDPVISTTGKASRELFEIREKNGEGHECDFLTVGSMGHASSIALGVALNKPKQKIWCIDGDGALLMHMGAMPVIGSIKPCNLVHIVINNGAHETVGGMPTVASSIDIPKAASAFGYQNSVSVDNFEDLDSELKKAKDNNILTLIEVKCSIGARENLGRPTTKAIENKNNFMKYLKTLNFV